MDTKDTSSIPEEVTPSNLDEQGRMQTWLLAERFEIMNKIFVHFIIMDSSFRLLHVKPSTSAALGYSPDELLGMPFEDMVMPNRYAKLRHLCLQTRRTHSLFSKVYFKRKEGSTLPLDFIFFNVIKHGRELFIGVGERVNSTAPIVASAKRERVKELRALYTIDRLLHEAETLDEALIGISDILNRAMSRPQLTRSTIFFDERTYMAKRLPRTCTHFTTVNIIISGQARGYIEMGYKKPVATHLREEQQMLSEVASILAKVIERKEMAEKLEANSRRLQTLFDAITDLVFMSDTDWHVKMVNKDMDVIGSRCYEAFWGLSTPCKDCLGATVKRTKIPQAAERQHGEAIYEIRVYPVMNASGEVTDLLEIAREVTKEKILEQQLTQSDRLASLGALVSGIAHEINNPNTFIRGNIAIVAEAMRDILPLLDERATMEPDLRIARLPYSYFKDHVTTLLDDMEKGADRIKNIVSDLKKFARRDEGLLNEDVALNDVVESCLRLVHNQIKRSVKVHLDLVDELPCFRGNIQKIEQVLVNVIINASHAVDERRQGKGSLGTIWIATELLDHTAIRLTVRDDGVGMSEATRRHIFDPFFTTKRQKQGTGLGLSIAYSIIDEHGGAIAVDSEVGEGSTFTITFPLGGTSIAAREKGA